MLKDVLTAQPAIKEEVKVPKKNGAGGINSSLTDISISDLTEEQRDKLWAEREKDIAVHQHVRFKALVNNRE
jgi:hypothetical protein